jgi:hypothetical protein
MAAHGNGRSGHVGRMFGRRRKSRFERDAKIPFEDEDA